MRDRASELRAIADGRLMLNVRNGVTVSRSMLAMIADEIDALRAAPTVAAQQCRPPEGLDVTDMDMIRRGDMLGPVLGASAASLIQSQAARIAELEAVTADLAMDLEAELNARYGMDPVYPAESRRKERDMEPVLRARRLLNKDASHD